MSRILAVIPFPVIVRSIRVRGRGQSEESERISAGLLLNPPLYPCTFPSRLGVFVRTKQSTLAVQSGYPD
jgi:hypothetical protein